LRYSNASFAEEMGKGTDWNGIIYFLEVTDLYPRNMILLYGYVVNVAIVPENTRLT
jgi:hypothetical protein